jgi:hypothetical protein
LKASGWTTYRRARERAAGLARDDIFGDGRSTVLIL